MSGSVLTPQGILDNVTDFGLRLNGTDFPVSVFPQPIRHIIQELHECQSFPVDYVAASMLTAIAVGIGNTHLVQVKNGWLESAILYMALVGRPGANKSHPLSFAMKPYLTYDYQQSIQFEQDYRRYEELMQMTRRERTEAGLTEYPQEPVRKRFLVSDITPEGLSLIHAQNQRGLCLWADELSAWFKNFNRYNNGSEEQFWLSVFSAKTTISDRKSARSSVFIKRPYISVIGTIQKKVLGELAKGERSCNGFTDRILFVLPSDQQKIRWNDRELSEDIDQQWEEILSRLIHLEFLPPSDGSEPYHILCFLPEARAVLYEYQHKLAEMCDTEPSEVIVGIYCKLETYLIRFCLIIQMMRWACGEATKEAIDAESVEKATLLTEYFRMTALNVQGMMNEESLTTQQLSILYQLPQEFTTAEGLELADREGMKERAFKDFLSRNVGILFKRERHGAYSKL